MYNVVKEGEFGPVREFKFIKKKKTTQSKPIKMHNEEKTKYYYTPKAHEPDEILTFGKSIKTMEGPIVYSFPKSLRNIRTSKPKKIDDNRFSCNPREIYPDPYELTHKAY